MKKSRIIFMILLFLFISLHLASAFKINMYLNGDKNFPLIYSYGAAGNAYIDKSSLNVQLYNPPYYRIAAIIVETSQESNEIGRSYTAVYEYRWDNDDKRYMFEHSGEKKEYLNRKTAGMAQLREIGIGESMFYLAYHRKFYGEIFDRKYPCGVNYSCLDGTYGNE